MNEPFHVSGRGIDLSTGLSGSKSDIYLPCQAWAESFTRPAPHQPLTATQTFCSVAEAHQITRLDDYGNTNFGNDPLLMVPGLKQRIKDLKSFQIRDSHFKSNECIPCLKGPDTRVGRAHSRPETAHSISLSERAVNCFISSSICGLKEAPTLKRTLTGLRSPCDFLTQFMQHFCS